MIKRLFMNEAPNITPKELDEKCAYKSTFYNDGDNQHYTMWIFPHEERENIYWYFAGSNQDVADTFAEYERRNKSIDLSAIKLNKKEVLWRHKDSKWQQVQDSDGPPSRDLIRKVCIEARGRMVIEKMLGT